MKRLLLVLSTIFMLASSAQQFSEDQLKKKINQTATAMKTMQCDFIQTKNIKMLNDKLVSKGKMYYQQGNKLRWEYISPYQYVFILNNDKVLIKNNQRNDVVDVKQNKMFKEITRIMMSSVIGNCLTDDKGFKTSITANSKEWIANLLPLRKDMKQMFQKMILHFNPQKAIVTSVELIERNGDKTVIELKNVRVNETLRTDMFAVR